MKKNYISEKEDQKNEDFCPCGCIDQLEKLTTGNPLVNKKVNKKNSCC